MDLPLAAVERVIRKSTGLRVSESASKELLTEMERHGREISIRAVALVKHAKRATVTGEDIRLAMNATGSK